MTVGGIVVCLRIVVMCHVAVSSNMTRCIVECTANVCVCGGGGRGGRCGDGCVCVCVCVENI